MGSLLPIFLNDVMIFCSWLEKSTYAVLGGSALCVMRRGLGNEDYVLI